VLNGSRTAPTPAKITVAGTALKIKQALEEKWWTFMAEKPNLYVVPLTAVC
jgi:hypothetical protein|tara:strand:- start:537 stop:689 length:153 start_codon:yes stop_codon:yes gene_type:complete